MSNISVIIPVHEVNEKVESLLTNAINSVKEQTVPVDELLIVVPKGSAAAEYMAKYDFAGFNARIVENDGETDFATQFNCGVEACTTEWFTMLEMDDELGNIWIKNFIKYKEAYPDVEMFLPLVVDVQEDGAFIGLTNEAVWAQQFSDELGYLDNGALLAYQNFNIDGMTMTKEKYQEIGGIKANIKLTFIYEFLLRATFQATRVMVIPRFGYKHVNQREGSLFANYKDELSPMEANWWLEAAKTESFHPEDRELIYGE